MFTGIVQGVGRIVHGEPRGDGVRLVVDASSVGAGDVAIGDSIAVNGCCLTVVAGEGERLAFDVSAETLRCTAGLDGRGPVNLEKALRAGDRLGGHLMSGHVDGVGVVSAVVPVAGDEGSVTLVVDAPAEIARYIAPKGSVAVQGVSLTVNTVEGRRFAVNLIPHTLAVTTLSQLAPGDRVNVEVDVIARYVARLLEVRGG
ncbi:MAG TPA: riboflavin synthase [Casimicrobiaceae bacterium]|jgi:riboflavin synthase